MNLLDSSIESEFDDLVFYSRIQSPESSLKILQMYFDSSPIFSQVNLSQGILGRRYLSNVLSEQSQKSFSLAGLWKKLTSAILHNKNAEVSKLALLDFNIDFLLDLLLFRVKYFS